MKHSVSIYLPLGVMSVLALLSGCDREPQAQTGGQAPLVTTVTLEPEPLVLTTELPGRTSSFRVAEIRPQVSGLLEKRLFTEGADVEAGDVLYQIDSAPFEAEVASAKANVLAAEKSVGQAKAALQANEAAVVRQQAMLDLSKINRDRYSDLFEEKAVAESERDQASTDFDVANASMKTAEAQVENNRQAIAVAEATIAQAKAALKTAQINLDYTKIKAPISGRIGRSTVTDGAIVNAYQAQALATIQQLDPIYVDVPQSTAQLMELKRRVADGHLSRDGKSVDDVTLIFEDGTRYEHTGEMQFQEVTVDPTTGSVIVRMVFPNPDGELLPGMFVRVELKEGSNDKAILVPQQGVSRNRKGEAEALVVDESGTVIMRTLEIDRSVGNRWLVSHGLKAGDRVIVEGSQRIRAGVEVNAVAFDPDANPTGNPAAKQSKEEQL